LIDYGIYLRTGKFNPPSQRGQCIGNGIDSFELSNSLSEIQQKLEDLRTRCISDPGNAEEILSDALEHLQATFEMLSATDEELVQQNQDLTISQKALRESEECYHAFIALSSEGIWRLETEQPLPITIPEDYQIEFILEHAYIAECNDACARMYGLTEAEELKGRQITEILPRSDPRSIEVIRDFIRSGYRLVDKEIYEVDKDGNSRCISTSVTGIVENNCLLRSWGVQHDITERKRAEEELHYHANLVDNISDADEAGNVYNLDICTKFGRPYAQIPTNRACRGSASGTFPNP
jgi:PAS domain S-box-containing protein